MFRCKHCNRKYTPELKRRDLPESRRQVLNVTEVTATHSNVLIPPTNDEAIYLPARTFVSADVRGEEGGFHRIAQSIKTTFGRASRWAINTESTAISNKWGRLPEIALVQSCGLLLLAWTFVWARAGTVWTEVFFWMGLAVLIVPVAMRLYVTETPRHERIALILLLGGAFYLVKVMHSPYAFTFPDEFSHTRNVHEILENHFLFQNNPELPATAFYPGLATITSLLVSFSGLSPFATGLLVIGAARLVLFLALFSLYEQVSGSARVGSLATLFYMANANFLLFTAAFSYEALALPIAILVLYIVARREMTNEHRPALTVVALLGVFMVVISHHMTSYILTVLLFAAAGISILRTRARQRGPWALALSAALAVSSWLTYVASYTVQYLSPVLLKAVQSIFRLATQEESARQFFTSTSTGYVSPPWVQLIGFCSVLIIALGIPIGWLNIWRRYRHQIFFIFLGVIALAYLPMQALRLTHAGWETGNRSSAFIFIGVGFVLALATDYVWRFAWHVKNFLGKFVPRGLGDSVVNITSWVQWKSTWIHAAIVVLLIFGGFLSGWPPQARMPRPYLIDTGSHNVEPQSVEVAKWTHDYLGPDHRIATSKVGSKLFSAYGGQTPFTGKPHGIKSMLFSGTVGPSEREIIQMAGIEYIASDRRLISWDHMIGLFFFNQKSSPSYELIEFETYEKFDGLKGVNRILDSGDIVIYDVRVYLKTPLEDNVAFGPRPTSGDESTPVEEAYLNRTSSKYKKSPPRGETAEKDPISLDPGDKNLKSTPSIVGHRAGKGRHVREPVYGR